MQFLKMLCCVVNHSQMMICEWFMLLAGQWTSTPQKIAVPTIPKTLLWGSGLTKTLVSYTKLERSDTTNEPLILRRCHGTMNIRMTTAEMAPQPKLMMNVPQSGILSKPSTATSTHTSQSTSHQMITWFIQLLHITPSRLLQSVSAVVVWPVHPNIL